MQEWEEGKEFGMEAGRKCMGTPDRNERTERGVRRRRKDNGRGLTWRVRVFTVFRRLLFFCLFVVYIYIFKRPIIIERTWQQPIIMGQFH